MSDSDESGVTYTDVSSPFEESPDIGSPRADDHEHLELPEMLEDPYLEVSLQAPPSPDYIPGHRDPEQAPPSPDYVPGPEHADDEIVAEDQPYDEDASPNAQSPEYVPESNLEAHPEDDDNEDPKEDPVDYPVDGGDDGDDEEGSSEENEDDDMDIEADEKEEEEHPAPVDSVVVALIAADQAPSTEETEPFETDESAATPPPHPAYRMTARISIPALVHVPAYRREDRPEVTLPPRKRLGIALGLGYKVGESSSAAAARPAGGRDSGDLTGSTKFETKVRQDTDEIYMRLDDEQSKRQLLAGRLNMRQIVISEMLRADHRRSTEIIVLRKALQGQVTALQGQVIAL
nr:hypothetical protein [Tanacetum cinerariifolium]